jgi:predicted esterase
MGGFGAWSIARKLPEIWATRGIHTGALWFNGSQLVTPTVANALRNVPTYFACGTNDGLLNINQPACSLLRNAGNTHVEFVVIYGSHEYIEENVENMYLWMRNFVKEGLS